jgi:hypothetical protein
VPRLTAIKMEKARNVVRLRVASEILSTETSYANSLSLVSKVPQKHIVATSVGSGRPGGTDLDLCGHT